MVASHPETRMGPSGEFQQPADRNSPAIGDDRSNL
jgi:hypothetical protein